MPSITIKPRPENKATKVILRTSIDFIDDSGETVFSESAQIDYRRLSPIRETSANILADILRKARKDIEKRLDRKHIKETPNE